MYNTTTIISDKVAENKTMLAGVVLEAVKRLVEGAGGNIYAGDRITNTRIDFCKGDVFVNTTIKFNVQRLIEYIAQLDRQEAGTL